MFILSSSFIYYSDQFYQYILLEFEFLTYEQLCKRVCTKTHLNRVELVDAWPEVVGVTSECDAERLQKLIHSSKQVLWTETIRTHVFSVSQNQMG